MVASRLQFSLLFYIFCVFASYVSSLKEDFHEFDDRDIVLLSRSLRDLGPVMTTTSLVMYDNTSSEKRSNAVIKDANPVNLAPNVDVTATFSPVVALAAVAPPAMAPPAVTPPAVASPAVASPAVASPAVAPPAVVSPAVAPPAVAPPAVASPVVAPPAVAPPAVASPTVPNLLGFNGTGIRRDNSATATPVPAAKSISNDTDPAFTNEQFPKSQDELLEENHITITKNDTHIYYNSTYYKDPTYFSNYWEEISNGNMLVNDVLSNSHRHATKVVLTFDFPFYGEVIRNVTIATGGFMYLGSYVHSWLAATQYIAPLMANFDTSLFNDSYVKHIDNGTALTVLWENVSLKESNSEVERFTFAATLHKSGDIVFAYKTIPVPIQSIEDREHPVKVGLSDAYIIDKLVLFARRKTIFEYHRVDFRNQSISSGTVLKLNPLPTCLEYKSCEDCINHKTNFNCSWCSILNRCSNGNDRNKHDWTLRQCDENAVREEAKCPIMPKTATVVSDPNQSTAYTISKMGNMSHNVVIKQDISNHQMFIQNSASKTEKEGGASVAGALVSAVSVITVFAALAWVLYAYRNPHTRSGQLLISYRPSNWGWRRGEARYTAATIHM